MHRPRRFYDEKPETLFLLGDSIFIIAQKNSDFSAFKDLDIPVVANGGDSRMALNFLKRKAANKGFKPDILLPACGLHDVKRDPVTQMIAVEESEYRCNLKSIYALLSAKKIPLIWIRTTGIIDSIHRLYSIAGR